MENLSTDPAPPPSDDLQTVVVETLEGDLYRFPSMPSDMIKTAARSKSPSVTSLTLVNVSGATLVLPWRIVRRLVVGEEEVWHRD